MGGISYTVSNPHLMGVSAGSYSLAELMFPTLCVGVALLECIMGGLVVVGQFLGVAFEV